MNTRARFTTFGTLQHFLPTRFFRNLHLIEQHIYNFTFPKKEIKIKAISSPSQSDSEQTESSQITLTTRTTLHNSIDTLISEL
jgi:hypothetical protein